MHRGLQITLRIVVEGDGVASSTRKWGVWEVQSRLEELAQPTQLTGLKLIQGSDAKRGRLVFSGLCASVVRSVGLFPNSRLHSSLRLTCCHAANSKVAKRDEIQVRWGA